MRSTAVASFVGTASSSETVAKAALVVATLLLMASMGGGFLLLPVLIPAHIWAARRSSRSGRLAWSLLPAASVAMLTWAAVYVAFGEPKPAIWLLPVVALLSTLVVVGRSTALPPGEPRA
jgi:hypothetical protein